MNQYSSLIEELKVAIKQKENEKLKMKEDVKKAYRQYDKSLHYIDLFENNIDYCQNKLPIDIKKEQKKLHRQKLLSIGKVIGIIVSINVLGIIGVLILSEIYIIEFINIIQNFLKINQFIIPIFVGAQTISYFKETEESRSYIKERIGMTPQNIEDIKNELSKLKEITKELYSKWEDSNEELQNICIDVKILNNKLTFVREQYETVLQEKYDKLIDEDFEQQGVQTNVDKIGSQKIKV